MRRVYLMSGQFGLCIFLAVLALAAQLTTVAGAAEKPSVEALLRQAYEHDRQGDNNARREALKQALEAAPHDELSRWQSGYVRQRRQWTPYAEMAAALQADDEYQEYTQRRQQATQTVAGQIDLANWCAAKGLVDQARAHWTCVLELDPNHAAARAKLGYRQAAGVWFSQREMEQASARAQQAAQDLARWTPPVRRILAGLEQNDARKRQEAKQRLAAIDNPAAILALETELAPGNREAAELTVLTLAKMPQSEAALALARLAVTTPWPEVSTLAADQLKTRSEDAFIPALLSAMSTPISTRYEIYLEPTGRLAYEHWLYREAESARELLGLRNLVAFRQTNGREAHRQSLVAGKAKDQIAPQLAAQAVAVEAKINHQNAIILERNARIGDVLIQTTGVQLPHNAQAWWDWWIAYNEIVMFDEKPTLVAFREYKHEHYVPTEFPKPSVPIPPRTSGSCLVAGTPVWTASGMQPIDKIQPGELVLAQHPVTGELAYKPVLKATVRPKAPLVTLRLGNQKIRATGGHPFWVLGHGWVRARMMQPGMRLAGLHGSVALEEIIEETVEEPTYNLIVDDAHSYFVSEALVLSHDNTIRKATEGPAPGLAAK